MNTDREKFLDNNLTKEYLQYQRISLGKSVIDIAKENNCYRGSVVRRLKKYKISTKRIKIDLVGRKFNQLTVLERGEYNGHCYTWICQCDCDKKTIVKIPQSNFAYKSSEVKSCGCSRQKNKVGSITGTYWSSIICNAKYRGYEFKITKEYAWEQFKFQSGKCKLTGLDLVLPENTKEQDECNWTASLDRIDSNIGYIEGNVQWVHKVINRMKMDSSEDSFKNFCTLVHRKNESDSKVYEWGLTSAIF